MDKRLVAAALAAGIAVVTLPRAVIAATLFRDDVAVELSGEFRVLYSHILEPDADEDLRPGTINRVEPQLRLEPTLWLNEFVALDARIHADAIWGTGVDPLNVDDTVRGYDIALARLGLRWQTPLGLVEIGRVGWHWGLGLLLHDGRSDIDRYGVVTATGAQDMLRLTVAPAGIHKPLKLTIFMRQYFSGRDSTTPYLDNGWSYGAALHGEPGVWTYGVLLRYDRHRDAGTDFLTGDVYLRWLPGVLALAAEGIGRWGNSDDVLLATNGFAAVQPTFAQWGAAGGVLRLTTPGWRAKAVVFETTGLETGAMMGDNVADVFTDRTWRGLNANPSYKVGLLLFPQLWQARQAALGERLTDAYAARFAGNAEAFARAYAARVGSGITNAWYIYPGFGLKTDDGLRFRLNALYARSISPLPTLNVADDRGTSQAVDDLFARESNLGFEVDVHLSYPLWGNVSLLLESGIAFPGAAFRNAAGNDAPVSFILAPRLTATF